MNSVAKWIATPLATALGLGYSPFAPGTAGSLGAITAAVLLVRYRHWGQLEFGLLAAVALVPAIWSAHVYERASRKKDPSRVVVDEVVGQWAALAGAATFNWKSWLAAFLLFRLFDIWKPFPARRAESLPGGLGIVADDVVAGLYGAVVLFLAGCVNLY